MFVGVDNVRHGHKISYTVYTSLIVSKKSTPKFSVFGDFRGKLVSRIFLTSRTQFRPDAIGSVASHENREFTYILAAR